MGKMKSFILVVIFIAFSVSADDIHSVQISKQIQCYLRMLKALIPADAAPQIKVLIKDVESVQDNMNVFSEEGTRRYLKDTSVQLAKVLPKLKNPKLRTLLIQIIVKIKAVDAKFESGNGDFNDIFNLNTIIKNKLKEHFGGGCGESTLPDGVTSTSVVLAQIKKYLRKLKASAPRNAKPIYDELAENTDDAVTQSIEFNRFGVIDALIKAANNLKKLIATLSDSQACRHQQNILEKLKTLINKLEPGYGTYLDVYEFLQFFEKTLAKIAKLPL